jgi:hypothetical protein
VTLSFTILKPVFRVGAWQEASCSTTAATNVFVLLANQNGRPTHQRESRGARVLLLILGAIEHRTSRR